MALVIERCWYTVTWFSQGYNSFIRNELETNNNIYKSCFYAVIGCNSWLSSNGPRKSTGIMYLCSIISSQGVFIRMKWDKLIAKDAVLVHLFLNSDVLGPRLPTAWHVHTVTAVFALGKLHLFSIQMRLRIILRFFPFFSEKTIDSTFDSHNRQILVHHTKHIHRKWIIRKSTRLIIRSEKNQEMSYSQDNSYLIHWWDLISL